MRIYLHAGNQNPKTKYIQRLCFVHRRRRGPLSRTSAELPPKPVFSIFLVKYLAWLILCRAYSHIHGTPTHTANRLQILHEFVIFFFYRN